MLAPPGAQPKPSHAAAHPLATPPPLACVVRMAVHPSAFATFNYPCVVVPVVCGRCGADACPRAPKLHRRTGRKLTGWLAFAMLRLLAADAPPPPAYKQARLSREQTCPQLQWGYVLLRTRRAIFLSLYLALLSLLHISPVPYSVQSVRVDTV